MYFPLWLRLRLRYCNIAVAVGSVQGRAPDERRSFRFVGTEKKMMVSHKRRETRVSVCVRVCLSRPLVLDGVCVSKCEVKFDDDFDSQIYVCTHTIFTLCCSRSEHGHITRVYIFHICHV